MKYFLVKMNHEIVKIKGYPNIHIVLVGLNYGWYFQYKGKRYGTYIVLDKEEEYLKNVEELKPVLITSAQESLKAIKKR